MAIAACNGVQINYRRAGEGADVVLIHGLAANHAFWHLEVLLPLVRQYRVTVYDLRGHGYSSMPATGYTSAVMAEDLRQLLDQLAITRAHLVGHSLGGLVALHFTALYPARVASVVVADSRVGALQATNCARDWPDKDQALRRLRAVGLDLPDDEPDAGLWLLERLAQPEWREARQALKGSSLFMPFSPWGGGARSAERWLTLLRTTTARRDLSGFNGPSLEQLSAIQQPVLAYYGDHSTLLPSFAGLRRQLGHCEAVLEEAAGHFFPLSKSRWFAATVGGFLERVTTHHGGLAALEHHVQALVLP